MYCTTTCSSPVGELTLAGDEEHLMGLWLEGQKYFGARLLRTAARNDRAPVLEKAKSWLRRYFAGEKPSPSELPLRPEGSEFQRTVWDILCEIPYGAVTTYGAIAKQAARRLGRQSMSSQAAGGAVGRNPISIIIPCHRVVGADGSLTGYAGGLRVKVQLLEHEGADMAKLYVPARGTAL